MLYKIENEKIQTKALEYSVAYHCNLRCSSCSHMSPFLESKLPPLESFAADVDRLSTVLHAKDIRMIGGEPLLNPDIVQFLKHAKKSGIADTVMLTTNGLLLHGMKDEFWENVDFIWLSLYPGASPPDKIVERIQNKAKESNTRLDIDRTDFFRTTITTEGHSHGWITDMIFNTCKSAHLFHCHMIHEGLLYKCACPPFMPEYLGKLGIQYESEKDGFPIHGSEDLFNDLKNFLFTPKTLEACRFCLGYVGKWQKNHQLSREDATNPGNIPVSRKKDLHNRKFIQETVKYFARRLSEKLTGEQKW